MMFFITSEERRLIQMLREEQSRLRQGQSVTVVVTIDDMYISLGTVAPKGKISKEQPLNNRHNGHK